MPSGASPESPYDGIPAHFESPKPAFRTPSEPPSSKKTADRTCHNPFAAASGRGVLTATLAGGIGVAVLDVRLAGEETTSLVGSASLGSLGKWTVKRVVCQIKCGTNLRSTLPSSIRNSKTARRSVAPLSWWLCRMEAKQFWHRVVLSPGVLLMGQRNDLGQP